MNNVLGPDHGQRWVADTKLNGFGLRLWGNKFGGQKVFAIRVVGRNGKCLRASFKARDSWFHSAALGPAYGSSLGDYLDEARAWARDEIDLLKGRLTLRDLRDVRDEERARWEKAAARMRMLTLEEAARSVLDGMRARRLSEAYVDRVNELFHRISIDLKQQPLCKIDADAVIESFLGSGMSEGNIRVLRAFIGQIFERASFFDGTLGSYSRDFSKLFWKPCYNHQKIILRDMHDLSEEDFKRVFGRLEQEERRWQQAAAYPVVPG